MLRKVGGLVLSVLLALASAASAQSGGGTTHVVLTNDQHFTVANGKFLSGVYECSEGGYIDISCLLGQFPPMNCPAGQAIQSIDSSLNASCIDVGSGSGPAGADTYVQYNASGIFGADPNFTWNYTSSILTLGGGGPGEATFGGDVLANLGTPSDGTIAYCNNCNVGTSPCTTGGTGAIANRINGAWICPAGSSGGSGTVTSVGLTLPNSIFSIAGSPVTTSGTLAVTLTGVSSGGVPYFSSTSAIGSSATLAANSFVLGGGSGTTPYDTSTNFVWNNTKKTTTHTFGTLTAGDIASSILGTFPSTGASTTFGLFVDPTSSGNENGAARIAMGAQLEAGYTGNGYTAAGYFKSLAANTGTDLGLGTTNQPSSDVGLFAVSSRSGTGAGYKTGAKIVSSGSTAINYGVIGEAVSNSTTASSIGVLAIGGTSGATGSNLKNVGVYADSTDAATFNRTLVGANVAVLARGSSSSGYILYGVGAQTPNFSVDINGGIVVDTGGGPQTGVSASKTVRDAAGTGTCTLVFTSGLLTGGTC